MLIEKYDFFPLCSFIKITIYSLRKIGYKCKTTVLTKLQQKFELKEQLSFR